MIGLFLSFSPSGRQSLMLNRWSRTVLLHPKRSDCVSPFPFCFCILCSRDRIGSFRSVMNSFCLTYILTRLVNTFWEDLFSLIVQSIIICLLLTSRLCIAMGCARQGTRCPSFTVDRGACARACGMYRTFPNGKGHFEIGIVRNKKMEL